MTPENILAQYALSFTQYSFFANCLLSFLLAASCGPILAFIVEAQHLAQKKVFFEKCALQIMQMTVLVTGIALVAACSAIFFLVPPPAEALIPVLVRELGIIGGALACSGLCLFVWNKVRKNGPIRLLFSLISIAGGLALLLWTLSKKDMLVLTAQGIKNAFTLEQYSSITQVQSMVTTLLLQRPIPTMFIYALATGMALSALFAIIWLFIRRNRADFGRDYYTFSIRFLAKIVLIFIPVAMACAFFSVDGIAAIRPETVATYYGLLFALSVLAMLFALVIVVSATPMRHKITVLCALLSVFFSPLMQMPLMLYSLLVG